MAGQRSIYNLLQANGGIWLNIETIAKLCNMDKVQTTKHLKKMCKWPGIFKCLEFKHVKQECPGNFVIKYYRVNVFKEQSSEVK